MKLYYSSGTSSMSCVIAVEELGLTVELVEVSWSRNVNVIELESYNPLGTVPTLVLDDGRVLTQNSAVLTWLAEEVARERELLPPVGTFDRAETVRWLAFVAADFHKAFTVAFRAEDMTAVPEARSQIEAFARTSIRAYLAHLDSVLQGRAFIASDRFTIADCYLVTVLGWCEWVEIGLEVYPSVQRYLASARMRPGVAAARDHE